MTTSGSEDNFDAFVEGVLADGEQETIPASVSPKSLADEPIEHAQHYASVVLSTTPEIPGRSILSHKGLVSGRVVKGQGIWKNFKMLMGSDAFGVRSQALEKEFAAMEQESFRQLKAAAFAKGANAIVGVTVHFGETSGEADLFYVIAAGTAVIAE